MTPRHFEFSCAGLSVMALQLDGSLLGYPTSSLAVSQLGKLRAALGSGGALPAGWRELSRSELSALESEQ